MNLIVSLPDQYHVHVIISAYEFRSKKMKSIELDKCTRVLLPGSNKEIPVWYAKKNNPGVFTHKKLFREKHADIVYLNGIFSYSLFVAPLIAIKALTKKPKIIISPRGMLQRGALQKK